MNYQEIIEKLSLEQKIKLCCNADNWHTAKFEGILDKQIEMNDGPHGLRHEIYDENGNKTGTKKATAFAANSLVAQSWNSELFYEVGQAMADECKAANVNILLGPGINIKRNPLCGRNMEYMSEDPYLSGKLGAAWIKGLQSKNVGASLKHFACNDREKLRKNYDVIVDERTLREIYLKGFEICVKEAKPKTIMSSYNKINGKYTGQSKEIVEDILRNEWGYEGLVVSDWGAVWDRTQGFEAGLDLEAPYENDKFTKQVIDDVHSGKLSEDKINASCLRVLKLIDELYDENEYSFDEEHNKEVALKEAQEGIVLLKNDGILPLSKDEKLLVVGEDAKTHIVGGGGSSDVPPTETVSLLDGLDRLKIAYDYHAGTNEKTGDMDLSELTDLSAYSSVICVVGYPRGIESEGFDRQSIELSKEQIDIYKYLRQRHSRVICVTVTGSVIDMRFADDANALLHLGFSGQMGGLALARILFGEVNPSGKLTESFIRNYEDNPSKDSFAQQLNIPYKEGIYVGYRYYQKAGIDVVYPFGYGLSYTTFEYSDLKLKKDKDLINVSFNITNTGKVNGKETAQVYIGKPQDNVPNPIRELKGFEKIELKPGETKSVSIDIPLDEFKFYDVKSASYVLEAGDYQIEVGASSQDIRLKDKVSLEGETVEKLEVDGWYFAPKGEPSVEQFKTLYGKDVPVDIPSKKITRYNTFGDLLNGGFFARMIGKAMMAGMSKTMNIDPDTPKGKAMMNMSMNVDLDSMAMGVGDNLVDGLIDIANGRLISGAIKMMKKSDRNMSDEEMKQYIS
ncbi:MAG: glycoside hydrolase family 3 C-terminal domain-containing protein [Erysipelotrichaceae bacterium]|nr:glycoside hydrolase family 3 C-terminal domain-containing protein [Erysipelotrichaceae bacterium]